MKGDGSVGGTNPWKVATDLVLFFGAVAVLALLSEIFKKADENSQHHRLIPYHHCAVLDRRLCQRALLRFADITGSFIRWLAAVNEYGQQIHRPQIRHTGAI
jgi:hypothetical protein